MKKYSIYFLMVLFVLGGFACSDDDDDDGPAPTPALPIIDFGAPYQILDNGGDLDPVLAGDSLRVTVGYSGCSNANEFELRTRVLNSTRAEVWLFKTTEEACQAYFQVSKTYILPQSVLEKENIVLVGPDFNSFTLR
jgi:hypothetical protein